MSTYFRITAHHPGENISLIIDSNGKFEKLWQFSSFLVSKGFKILEAGNDSSFHDGNIPKAFLDAHNLILRACKKGEPIIFNNTITINGRHYSIKND